MTAPSGFLWEPYTTARTLLSESDAVQTWLNVQVAADALPSIHLFQTAHVAGELKCITLSPPDDHELVATREATGTGLLAFTLHQRLVMGFYEELPAGVDYAEDSAITFLNNVGAMVAAFLGKESRYDRMETPPWNEAPLRFKEGSERGYQKVLVFGKSI